MLQRMPLLGQRLVSLMADRIRETTRIETQRDKLMALGKLSAGLAHELNNPAAAAQRATASLRETLETVRDASIRLARHALSTEQREMITHFEREAGQYTGPRFPRIPWPKVIAKSALPPGSKAATCRMPGRSRRPSPTRAWIFPSWKAWLPRWATRCCATRSSASRRSLTIARLISEIEISTKRISHLVQAIKEYSYMDQAAMQEVDLHQGLENTLTILHHRLKGGINVVREYDENLPQNLRLWRRAQSDLDEPDFQRHRGHARQG